MGSVEYVLKYASILWWKSFFHSMFSTLLKTFCKAGLMATNSSLILSSRKYFISSLSMKYSLAESDILGWNCFSLRNLKIGPQSLMACKVTAENSDGSLMGFSSYMSWSFSLSLRFFFSFVLALERVVTMVTFCLGDGHF